MKNNVWEAIKKDYETIAVSFRQLEKHYKIEYSKIRRVAIKESWVKYAGDDKGNFVPIYLPKTQPTLDENINIAPPKKSNIDYANIDWGELVNRKIKEIINELGDKYSSIDEPLIVMYAKSYERYLKLTLMTDEEGETLISYKTGSSYLNPNFIALQAVEATIMRLSDKLGLSIASRVRLKLNFGNEVKELTLFDLIAQQLKGDDE